MIRKTGGGGNDDEASVVMLCWKFCCGGADRLLGPNFSKGHHKLMVLFIKTNNGIKMILVRAECVRQRNKVAIILGIISVLSLCSAICSEQTWSLIGR